MGQIKKKKNISKIEKLKIKTLKTKLFWNLKNSLIKKKNKKIVNVKK